MSTPLPQPLEVPSGPIKPERWRESAREKEETKKNKREKGKDLELSYTTDRH